MHWSDMIKFEAIFARSIVPFLTKFGLRLQVHVSGFKLTTLILEAARSIH